jgi:hypothetical protein
VPLLGKGWAVHEPDYWPVDVLDALKALEPKPGDAHNKLFNSGYIDGGFVIYHAPGYKVFVDDRCELFTGEWLKRYNQVENSTGSAAPDAVKALARWEEEYGPFDFALSRTGRPLDEVFRTDPAWEPVKITPTATFYKRK